MGADSTGGVNGTACTNLKLDDLVGCTVQKNFQRQADDIQLSFGTGLNVLTPE